MPDSYKPPYMRWFMADFSSDPMVQMMTPEQRHLYAFLLLWAFQVDSRPCLPDDDSLLAFYAGTDIETWKANRDAVMARFELTERGWANKRVVEEYDRACTKANISRVNGAVAKRPAPSEPPNNPKAWGGEFVLPDWVPTEEWKGYLEMRRKIKKAATPHAMRLAVKSLENLKTAGNDPRAVLEQSIMNSWQGLFPLKSPPAQSGNQPSKPRLF